MNCALTLRMKRKPMSRAGCHAKPRIRRRLRSLVVLSDSRKNCVTCDQLAGCKTQRATWRMVSGGTNVLLMVLRQGLMLAGTGIVLGLVLSLMLAHTLSAQLFGVTASDPLVHGAAILSLGLIAAVASYIPARRATMVNPTTALRQD